jgi:hypothetical protein
MEEKVRGLTKSLFLVINAKGGEILSPKKQDCITTFRKILSDIFKLVCLFSIGIFKDGISKVASKV